MIYINHEKQLVFIHIPKTGGSYVGSVLTTYYGFKSFVFLFHTQRNDHQTICGPRIFSGNTTYDQSFFNRRLGVFPYALSSVEWSVRMGMTPERWKTYKKFCFIRNPATRFVSGWNHMNVIFHRTMPLATYVANAKDKVSDIEYGHVWMSQMDHIGGAQMDFVGRFEHLENDLCEILQRVGFDIRHIPRCVNAGNVSDSVYTIDRATANRIQETFACDGCLYSSIQHM